jgi:hypothetical protein
MPPPISTPILCFVDIDNLETLMRRGALHEPNQVLADGLPYRVCEDPEVQGAQGSFVRFSRIDN